MVGQDVCRAALQYIGDLLHLYSEVDIEMAYLAVEIGDLDLLVIILNYLVSRDIFWPYYLVLLVNSC